MGCTCVCYRPQHSDSPSQPRAIHGTAPTPATSAPLPTSPSPPEGTTTSSQPCLATILNPHKQWVLRSTTTSTCCVCNVAPPVRPLPWAKTHLHLLQESENETTTHLR